MSTKRIAVLMGGTSSERDVSLRSGANVAAALDRTRYTVLPLDFTGDLAPILALKGQVDLVFPALHGPGGEDGRLQGLLDLLDIPYVGTGALGSAMAMHKGVARGVYALHGISTAAGFTAVAVDDLAALAARVRAEVGVPCVVKPANEGSSIGITIVTAEAALEPALATAIARDRDLVIEQFVVGTEISVPVIGIRDPRVLPAVEIIPRSGTYSYEDKYAEGGAEEICPARISAAATATAADYALRAHAALFCRGVSRTDMIVCGDAVTVLETNTLPGMTNTSLLPKAAETVGLSFADLVNLLVADALEVAGA